VREKLQFWPQKAEYLGPIVIYHTANKGCMAVEY